MTEKELDKKVIRAKSGNEEDFSDIINYYKNEWFRIAKSRLLNDDDASDAVQETIISIFLSLNKLKNIKKFKTWSTKILINKCNTIYEKYTNRKELSIDSADNSFQFCENEIVCEDILKLLDSGERVLITLFYVEKYTSKEIGKIMDMNMNTVKTKLFRAKNKIKRYLNIESEGKSIYG